MMSETLPYRVLSCCGLTLDAVAGSFIPLIYSLPCNSQITDIDPSVALHPDVRGFLASPESRVRWWHQRLSGSEGPARFGRIEGLLRDLVPSHVLLHEGGVWVDCRAEAADVAECNSADLCPGCLLSFWRPSGEELRRVLGKVGAHGVEETVRLLQVLSGWYEMLPGIGAWAIDIRDPKAVVAAGVVERVYGIDPLPQDWEPCCMLFHASTSEPIIMNSQGQFGWWRWKSSDPVKLIAASAWELEEYLLPYFEAIVEGKSVFERPWLDAYAET